MLHEIVSATGLAKELTLIRPGHTIKVLIDKGGKFRKLVLEKNAVEAIEVVKTGFGYKTRKIEKKIDREIAYAHGVIKNSLFLDAKAEGLSDKVIMQLASIFAWDIDFALNLRVGDQFTIVYEKLFLNGERIDTGEILAAEFVNRGIPHQAVRYSLPDGNADHYSPDGKAIRKAFLRTPIEFARVSSRFNLRRRHPVLNRIRAHKGVDYAAATGTPIRSTGDGKIVFQGRKGGYGRTVIVKHGHIYSTLYAHLSRFDGNVKKGTNVKQGQIIGYVGRSGLATGPHLHYEFRVYGVHQNPLTVKLPESKPIDQRFLADFRKSTQLLLSQLDAFKTILLARKTG